MVVPSLWWVLFFAVGGVLCIEVCLPEAEGAWDCAMFYQGLGLIGLSLITIIDLLILFRWFKRPRPDRLP